MIPAIIITVACHAGIGTFQSRTPDIPYTLVPGDVASSVIVASMASTAAGQGSQDSPNITQACTSCSNPLTLRQLTDSICHYFRYACFLLGNQPWWAVVTKPGVVRRSGTISRAEGQISQWS